ncbi:amidohydrolase, partial [Thioclava sp. BHET1]
PHDAPGVVGVKSGPAMAGANFFDITVTGRGGHAARPEAAIDALLVATGLVQQLQTIVSRSVAPTDPVVLSVTQIQSGSAYNVIPETATIRGTVRYFDDAAAETVSRRMQEICDGFGRTHGATITLEMRNVFDVLRNDPTLSQDMLAAATDVVGADRVRQKESLVMGSEDFADMLRVVPGAYCTLGHGSGVPVHNPGFLLDDAILPLGAAVMARMVETRGAAG